MDRDELARIAMRYDTAMSRAMLRALGLPMPMRKARNAPHRIDRYDGMDECFSNRRRVRV